MKFFFLSSLLLSSLVQANEVDTATLLPTVVCQGREAAGEIKETVIVPIPKPTRNTPLDQAQRAKANYLKAVNDFMKKGGFFNVASNPRRVPTDGPYNLDSSTFMAEMNDEASRYNFYIHWVSPWSATRDNRFQIVRVSGQTYILPFVMSHRYRELFEYSDFKDFVSGSVPVSDREPSSLMKHANDLWVEYFEKNVHTNSSPSDDTSRIIYSVTLDLNHYCRDGRKITDLTAKE